MLFRSVSLVALRGRNSPWTEKTCFISSCSRSLPSPTNLPKVSCCSLLPPLLPRLARNRIPRSPSRLSRRANLRHKRNDGEGNSRGRRKEGEVHVWHAVRERMEEGQAGERRTLRRTTGTTNLHPQLAPGERDSSADPASFSARRPRHEADLQGRGLRCPRGSQRDHQGSCHHRRWTPWYPVEGSLSRELLKS